MWHWGAQGPNLLDPFRGPGKETTHTAVRQIRPLSDP